LILLIFYEHYITLVYLSA